MAEANGLYYMRARYYDSRVGRFISEDPIGFAGGDTNLYAYVQNNSVNRIDPWGEQDITVEIDSMSGLPYFKRTILDIEHHPRLGGGGGGSNKCAAKGGVERIAGSKLSHINGAIGEAHGWRNALEAGHIGIQSPGKVTAPGADFITYNPQTQNIVVWDAKYRGPGGSYPSSFPATKLQKWMPGVVEAVKNMAPGPARTAAERALLSGKVIGQLLRWPQ
jgi:RHS repeat-associated protein